MSRLRVYISSTFEDLKEYRAAVFAALEKGGLEVARMEGYTAADERPLDLCLRDVSQSEIYVGLFAWSYGYEPPAEHGNSQGKSITELEYRQAERANLRKLLFFAHPDTKTGWPDCFKDEVTGQGLGGRKLKEFVGEVGIEKTASYFRTPDQLATLVLAAILRSGASGRAYNVPPLPSGFVPRPKLTKAIVDSLIGAGGLARGANTVVPGAGGFGKTMLAIDACHQAEVINAFADGLLWITLGEKPDLATKLGDLHKVATGKPPAVAGVEDIGRALAKALARRRYLVVVDDAWRPEDIAPFLDLDGPLILVTTRIQSLVEQAGRSGWPEVPVDQMEVGEAAAILGRGLAIQGTLQKTLEELANNLGCWPLLLELANARLLEEQKERKGNVLESIKRVTSLFERNGVLGFDRRNSDQRNAAVANSVNVGLGWADKMFPGLAEKAAEMSVFPEDVAVPQRVLADLWAMDEFDLEEDALRPLANLSVLQWAREAGEVRLHDMIRRVLETRLAEPSAVHRRLISAWGDPYHLPHDYAWRWFGWHSAGAMNQTGLMQFLLDFDWLRAKLAATGIDALLGDFDHIRGDTFAHLLQRACRLSAYSLAKDKSQLGAQLLARIPEQYRDFRDRILRSALATGEPWLRPLTASLVAERSLRWTRTAGSQVALTPNGLWAAYTCAHDGGAADVVLWSIKDWQSKELRFRTRPRKPPYAIALSDDGQWCLYADSLGRVHRLGASGVPEWEGRAHRELTIALYLAISADGRRAVSACQHGRLVAWDIDAGRHEIIWDESVNYVRALTLDAGGDSVVVARKDGSIILVGLWPTRHQTLFKLDGEPSAIARSRDNLVVAAAAVGGRVEVRPARPGQPPIKIVEAPEKPTSLALSSSGQYLALGTVKGTVEVWDLTRGARSASYGSAHTYEVKHVGFSNDDVSVISIDSLHIKEWALDAAEEVESVRVTGRVKVTTDGGRAVAALDDGRLGVWDMQTGALESALPRPTGPAFSNDDIGSPDGIALADVGARVLLWNERLLCVWDLERGISAGSLSASGIRDAAITPDGAQVVFASGKDVAVWRPEDARSLVLGTYDGDSPGFVAISPDGNRALSSGGARKVVFWDLNERSTSKLSPLCRAKRELGENDAEIASYWPDSRDKPARVAFVEPSKAIVTTGDGSLFLVDCSKPVTKGLPFASAHGAFVSRVLANANGTLAVTSSFDGTIRVWNLRSRESVAVLSAHPGAIEKISAGIERALLFSDDGVLKLISLNDGALIAAFEGDKRIYACDADPELKWIVACDQGGQMHFLHLEH